MRTVTFDSVLQGVAVRCGLDVTQTIPGNLAAAYTEYINRRVRQAWEAAAWPDFTLYERRQFRADWDAGTGYAVGDEVYQPDDGLYYRAIASTTGNEPPDVTYWAAGPSDFLRNIDFEQAGKTAMGEVMAVTAADPRLGYARPVDYVVTGDGIVCGAWAPALVWVTFMSRPTVFTSTSGSAAFPYVIAEMVKAGAAADVMREEGMPDKAGAFDAVTADLFQQELDKLEYKQGQSRNFAVAGR